MVGVYCSKLEQIHFQGNQDADDTLKCVGAYDDSFCPSSEALESVHAELLISDK